MSDNHRPGLSRVRPTRVVSPHHVRSLDDVLDFSRTGRREYAVGLKDERPFVFAGLWDRWKNASEIIESCTIITTDANELLKPIHDRMPVILSEDAYERWLDPSTQNPAAFQPLLKPYDSDAMKVYPVSTRVNDPKNDDSECIAPLPQQPSP